MGNHQLLDGRVTTVMTDPYIELLAEVGDRFVSLEEGCVVGDQETLDAALIERASLRVPQLLRLSQALGRPLSSRMAEALPFLRQWANGKLPPRMEKAGRGQPVMIRATGLAFSYPNGPTAVNGVDVSFSPGEFVAILGSNGSGKTTLALLLAGALTPMAGAVFVDGQPFNPAQHRGIIGYVFQEPVNQIVTMKVADELAFGPEQLGWDEAAVAEAVAHELARFGLAAEAVPLHLTPAEARKVAIAATLTMKPCLVILDEPTNNLDEDEVRHLMAHLKALQERGTTVVLITHDVEIACEFAERVIVMARGDILADGPTRQIMAQQELLSRSDVVVPPVVALSLALWPNEPPALTVAELADVLKEPVLS